MKIVAEVMLQYVQTAKRLTLTDVVLHQCNYKMYDKFKQFKSAVTSKSNRIPFFF